jgi:hypothetical protein
MFSAPLQASLEAPRGSSSPGLAAPGVAAPGPHPSWPWARLASLHRWSPRGLRPPAMALLRFGVSTAHQALPIALGSCVPIASASWVRPTWRLGPGLALPTDPVSAALARFPSRSLPPPGSVPVSRPMPSCGSTSAFQARRAPFQGFDPRTKWLEVLERPRAASSGFPSRVFSSTALAHGFFPGPSSRALSAPSTVGGRHAALQSLA